MRAWQHRAPGPDPLGHQFPESRELSREFLEISHDSGLLARLWEPVVKRIQSLAAVSLLLQKQGIFLP
jgi:hypothetical protein